MTTSKCCLLLLILSNILFCSSIRFHVQTNGKKCLKEEIHRNVVMTGDYEFSDLIGHTSSVHVGFWLYFLKNSF